MSNDMAFTTVSSKGQIVIPNKVRRKLGIKNGNVFTITEKKGLIVLKKLDQKLTADDISTLQSIQQAWEEIEHGKGGSAKRSEFFKEFAKW